MNDFAGVDPDRLRTLADRLKDLADTLARVGPTIRNNFSEWGGTLNLGPLHQQATQVGEDARKMALRADEALNLLRQPNGAAFCTPTGDWVDIPWDTKDINSAQEAQQEAATLKNALDHPKDAASRETIAEIGQSLADHQGDSAYMTAFMRAGGIADATKVARALHSEDGTHDDVVLAKDSERILGQFGQATQTMSTLAVKGDYPKPAPDYLAALTSPPDGDMWSVGMLFKYGPPGGKWDPKVLSGVSGAMLDWRDKQGAMRPLYEMMPSGGGPPAYYGDGKAWFNDLGLNNAVYPGSKSDRTVAAIRANDPVLAVLDRLGDNPKGSRDLLGQDTADSKRHAAQLLDYKWQTTGPATMDDSEPVSRILTLAATDRSPAFQDESGHAAYNILAAAAKENDAFNGRSKEERLEYMAFPQSTAVTLAGITATWADQLGATSRNAGPQAGGYSTKEHGLVVPHDDLVAAMQLFVRDDPSAAAMFDASMHQQLGDAAGSKDSSAAVTDLGVMVGLFTKAKNGVSYGNAAQLDEQHKYNLTILNTAGVLYSGSTLPKSLTGKFVTKGFKYSQTLLTWGRSVKAPTTDPFSTNNAAHQQAVNSANAKDVENSFTPALAQGLIRSGKVPIPVGMSWYDPTSETVSPEAWNNTDFITWTTTDGVSGQVDDATTDLSTGFRKYEGSLDGS
ncbi:hypothetical protein AB0M29_22515 [Streptomyces sp. NPDC051976]|uniref:hypothetical protein n=1 Tax=Streptomyces sp. NPDC051976 TaxID=3154947 RepID=UPI00342BAC16